MYLLYISITYTDVYSDLTFKVNKNNKTIINDQIKQLS